ncbi:hypothetical protein UFOVP195_48 [uncultured Caudovirales phage]|uniref:Uncharacterized protein n=1 Tax=uncultured Caudovirales phage TaxID=2100421 RepID=A0A6J7WH44_9CAUD|nr:hypothetical protein UFOVP195_48 [uncultured Caudovirales phage]
MATNTNINFPQSEFLDPLTKRPAREWMLWLMSPSVIALNSKTALSVQSGGTGLSTTPTDGQLLIGNGVGYTLNPLAPGAGISVTNASGSITVANTGVLSWSAGITGLTPATATTGNVTLSGLLNVASGGTGQSSYTDGQLLIGNTIGNTLGKATLTAGNGIAITNGHSSITIASERFYGAFSDFTSQPLASTATGQVMTFNTTDIGGHGVSVVSSSRMTVTNAGTYNFQWSGQFASTSASLEDVYVWLRINGTNVTGSTGLISVPSKHAGLDGHIIAAWNYLLNLNANDYVELMWGGGSTALSIATYAAGASPTRPSTASLIATFQQV